MNTAWYVLRSVFIGSVLPFLLGMVSYQAFAHQNYFLFVLSLIAIIVNLWFVFYRGV